MFSHFRTGHVAGSTGINTLPVVLWLMVLLLMLPVLKAEDSGDIPDSRKAMVMEIQQKLNELGFSSGKVDGIVGPITLKAIQEFKKRYHLIPTGRADIETLHEIRNFYAQHFFPEPATATDLLVVPVPKESLAIDVDKEFPPVPILSTEIISTEINETFSVVTPSTIEESPQDMGKRSELKSSEIPASLDRKIDETLDMERIHLIRSRGELIVGVKTDYPPWGGIDEVGNIVGMEPDFALELAKGLGVRLNLQGVSSSNRLSKLEDGSIDLMIATMGDTLQRREISAIIEPNYYASGVNLLIHKDLNVREWGELRGRKICLTDGAFFNRDLIQRYLIDPVIFKGTRDTQLALESGRCVGWAYDDTALTRLLKEDRWNDYGMPIKSIMIGPWAMAIKRSEKGSAFAFYIEDSIADWHRSGFLLTKEREWGIAESRFLMEQNRLWNDVSSSGEFFCRRNDDGAFPIKCLNVKLHQESGVAKLQSDTPLQALLLDLGIDFIPLHDQFSGQLLLKGIWMTLVLSVLAIIGSLGYGVGIAILYLRVPRYIGWLVNLMNGLLRMTPPILSLYILFFGVGTLLTIHYGWSMSAFWVAALIFSLYAGASNAVILIKSLEFAMVRFPERGVHGNLPEALNHSFTGLIANSVNIVKAIGIASAIAVPELISAANTILAEKGNTVGMMNFLMIFYFLLVALFITLLNTLKNRLIRWNIAK